jgi:hypothetical protein
MYLLNFKRGDGNGESRASLAASASASLISPFFRRVAISSSEALQSFKSGCSLRKPRVPSRKCKRIGIEEATKSQPKKVKDIFPLPEFEHSHDELNGYLARPNQFRISF